MSAYKFHGDSQELVPWNATYAFPTTSTKVYKQTVKIQPKNGASFGSATSGYKLRMEFPADSYLNPLNSYLNFNLRLSSAKDDPAMYAGHIARAANDSEGGVGCSAFTGTTEDGLKQFTINSQTQNTNWQLFSQSVDNKVTGFYAGWIFRYTSGHFSGVHAMIVNSGHLNGRYDLLLQKEIPSADFGDTYEIIPGWKFQQGGAHNLFSRVRGLYGSLVFEDIQYYSTSTRIMHEAGVQRTYAESIGGIMDGTHHSAFQCSADTPYANDSYIGGQPHLSVRSWESGAFDQLHDSTSLLMGPKANYTINAFDPVTAKYVAQQASASLADRDPGKIFNLSIFSGLMSQPKLIPLKWMAAQLAFEFEFNQPSQIFMGGGSTDLQYSLTNVNYVSELIEFDSTYDVAFSQELSKGVPLKFSSFDTFVNNVTGTKMSNQIQERARSVKYMLSVIRDTNSDSLRTDSDRFYQCLGETYAYADNSPLGSKIPYLINVGHCPVSDFQYRIGGRYYPAQPVVAGVTGGGEAFAELMKVVDYLGDYGKGTLIDMYSWNAKYLGGGSKFIMANCAENIDLFGGAISGINAEEQSDIMLLVNSSESSRPTTVSPTKYLFTFVAYDALLLITSGNNVELVK